MNKQSITFTANEQTLEKTGGIDHYASNIVSYIEATFTLGTNWTGYDVVRAVWESSYAKISTVLDSNAKCLVPAEVLQHKSKVNVNLVGSIIEDEVLTDRLTTYPVHALTVDEDARVDSTETQPVTPSQFEQFVEIVHEDAESIQDYSYDSEAWAKGTRGGVAVPSTDPTYHNNSKYYADQGAELEQEVDDLKSAINKLTGLADNVYYYPTYTQGGYYDGSGNFVASEVHGYTPLVPVEANTTYYLNVPAAQYIVYYDSNKDVIPTASPATQFSTGDSIKYVRISAYITRQGVLVLTKGAPYKDYIVELRGAVSDINGKLAHTNGNIEQYFNDVTVLSGSSSYLVDFKENNYTRKLYISAGSANGYYRFGLYKNNTLVWGDNPSIDDSRYVPANGSAEYIIPSNVEADELRIVNINNVSGTTFSIYSSFLEEAKSKDSIRTLSDGIIRLNASNTPTTITIASGTTGNNEYTQGLFYKNATLPYFSSGDTATAVIAVKATNYTPKASEFNIMSPNGVLIPAISKNVLYTKADGTVAYIIEFEKPSTDYSFIGLTYQIFNTTALSETATIEPVDFYLILKKYTKRIINAVSPLETVITVGAGKQYTRLRTALEYAGTIATDTHHITVQYFGNETEYDVMDDITADDLTTTSSFIGLTVPANCKLLGMGSWIQNKISLTLPENTDASVAFRISTINLVENAELENLWFYGKRCRYACHDDTQSWNPAWELKTVKNCRFTSDYTNQHRAYGAGYRSGVNWKFENCIFENINGEAESSNNGSFSAHNNNAISKTPSITFVNCQFSGGVGVAFESLNSKASGQTYPNAKTEVSFYGCKSYSGQWGKKVLLPLSSSSDVVEVMVTGFGNNFDNSDVGVFLTDRFIHTFDEQLTLWGKIAE